MFGSSTGRLGLVSEKVSRASRLIIHFSTYNPFLEILDIRSALRPYV
jgi:hypothetical protein